MHAIGSTNLDTHVYLYSRTKPFIQLFILRRICVPFLDGAESIADASNSGIRIVSFSFFFAISMVSCSLRH